MQNRTDQTAADQTPNQPQPPTPATAPTPATPPTTQPPAPAPAPAATPPATTPTPAPPPPATPTPAGAPPPVSGGAGDKPARQQAAAGEPVAEEAPTAEEQEATERAQAQPGATEIAPGSVNPPPTEAEKAAQVPPAEIGEGGQPEGADEPHMGEAIDVAGNPVEQVAKQAPADMPVQPGTALEPDLMPAEPAPVRYGDERDETNPNLPKED